MEHLGGPHAGFDSAGMMGKIVVHLYAIQLAMELKPPLGGFVFFQGLGDGVIAAAQIVGYGKSAQSIGPVSYTHLDVYKRQAQLCDVFYIGGTKLGALMGEAVVIPRRELQEDFRYLMKRHGGMLAKGRLLGLQFETLFTDGLYYEIGRHGNRMAKIIRDACWEKGYPFLVPPATNQLFPILPNVLLERLKRDYAYSDQGPVGADAREICIRDRWYSMEL